MDKAKIESMRAAMLTMVSWAVREGHDPEGESHIAAKEVNDLCDLALKALRDDVPRQQCPNEVWSVSHNTSVVLFESAEHARQYMASFGAATSGGMTLQPVPIIRAPSNSDWSIK